MKLSADQLIAVGRVLDEIGDQAEVCTVRVDGDIEATVADLRQAREAYEQAGVPSPREPGRLDYYIDKLSDSMDKLEDRLSRSALGRKVKDAITADPERVVNRVNVEVELADGKTITVPVEVLHRGATAFLQRTSTISELAAMLPLLGWVVPAITASVAAVGAGVARMVGKKPLARALWGTAGKHLLLTGTGIIPIVSTSVAAAAAVVDIRDHREVTRSPTVAEVVNLTGTQSDR